MAKLVKVHKDGVTSVEISVDTLIGLIPKFVQAHPDSDGANRWQKDNRYIMQYTVTGSVSLTELETLITIAQMAMGATYPKIDVYDKSASPYYNTYTPVMFESLQWTRISDNEWRVTCIFKW